MWHPNKTKGPQSEGEFKKTCVFETPTFWKGWKSPRLAMYCCNERWYVSVEGTRATSPFFTAKHQNMLQYKVSILFFLDQTQKLFKQSLTKMCQIKNIHVTFSMHKRSNHPGCSRVVQKNHAFLSPSFWEATFFFSLITPLPIASLKIAVQSNLLRFSQCLDGMFLGSKSWHLTPHVSLVVFGSLGSRWILNHQKFLLPTLFTQLLRGSLNSSIRPSNRLNQRCRQDAKSHLVAPLEKQMSVASNWDP